ncbi:MAG: hypothetical protein SPL30_03385 [Succinivibrio sp.]|jgi:hypothetical protein|nr:hypothetical protein [Succinivibrio sp.]
MYDKLLLDAQNSTPSPLLKRWLEAPRAIRPQRQPRRSPRRDPLTLKGLKEGSCKNAR